MFLVIWQFEVEETRAEEFERAYGADGVWAQFFRRSTGYVRTELVRNVQSPFRYVTLDYWKTEKDFAAFKKAFAEEYRELDRRCENFTKHEAPIGAFVPVENDRSVIS